MFSIFFLLFDLILIKKKFFKKLFLYFEYIIFWIYYMLITLTCGILDKATLNAFEAFSRIFLDILNTFFLLI